VRLWLSAATARLVCRRLSHPVNVVLCCSYLLGGSCHLEVAPFTPFEVYDPHLDSWFSASSPVQGPVSLSEHALVSNQQVIALP
jgi:hypothetical protein